MFDFLESLNNTGLPKMFTRSDPSLTNSEKTEIEENKVSLILFS